MMFHPLLYLVKQVLKRVKRKAQWRNLPVSRRAFERVVRRYNQPKTGYQYQAVEIQHIHAEWIIPPGADDTKVLLYFHGGGYAAGSVNTHRSLVSSIAKYAEIKALSIDYRLAPENKYPAPIEDAALVFEWLQQQGYAAQKIAFGGDSAGGGVTIGTLCYLRDKNLPLPKCAIALSPWLDVSCSGESFTTKLDAEPMLIAEAMPFWVNNYMANADLQSPYASPVFHSLKNLPPVYVQVGSDELLLDDSVRFAKRANEDGSKVTLEIFEGYFHVFQAFLLILPAAKRANRKLGAFLQQQLT